MKETGFVAYQHEVKAILEGRQTMFRRVAKPFKVHRTASSLSVQGGVSSMADNAFEVKYYNEHGPSPTSCPYGQVGDRLWVRETWAPVYASYSHEYPTEGYYFEWEPDMHGALEKDAPQLETYYRADGEGKYPAEIDGGEIHWKPSIFMPRWASRITLEITGVKVERIQDISESDVEREGTPMVAPRPSGVDRVDFAYLWDSINAKRGYGWDVNPWDWALTFKVVAPI